MDIFPATAGHLLIITKDHYSDLFEAAPEAIARVGENSVRVADAIGQVIKPDGLGIYQLNKAAAGQTVFHYHMHLIPQFEGRDIGIHSKKPADPVELAELADKFRKVMGD